MKTLHKLLALAAVTTAAVSSHAGTYANITIDGIADDWSGIAAAYTDASGDGSPGDIDQIFLANNDTHLFIRVTFHALVNPQLLGGFYIGIDNDSNPATGYDVYSLGVLGSEAGWQNDYPFEQATGSFNTGAPTDAAILISPYYTETTSQEFSISRTALIDTDNGQLVFPNNSFNLGVYFNGGTVDDFAGPVAYTFAAVPEPATWAFIGGIGALAICLIRRHRRR
ncbi:hypothetical protein OpiT1DRAFT_05190 [Opitutaceae bacterium TAV1]|nr:hypothetical protein OpiT1DRAFT_05190 [Opitutaceae bacterium TAV1]